METLEKMSDFFEKRVVGYDEHMLNEVKGCKEGYRLMAELIKDGNGTLLDLGCGTGLELDEIFALHPSISVTGIDLCQAMLHKLAEKHSDKKLKLICGDYFRVPFEKEAFDCAVSFQTMHHFAKKDKLSLYKKIYDAVKKGGKYIECDYMVLTQEEEKHWYEENARIRKRLGIPEGEFYHYDTPCCIDSQVELLRQAGFDEVRKVFRKENTTMLIAEKKLG